MLALACAATVLWCVRWTSAQSQYMGDSYQYAKRAYQMAGDSTIVAERRAMDLTCRWLHHRVDAAQFPSACVPGLHSSVPAYDAIFRERVGMPAAVAALMPVLGSRAFAVVIWASSVGVALMLACAVRLAGGSRVQAALAAGLLFVLPESAWLSRVGSEAPALFGLVATVALAMWWSQSRRAWVVLALFVVSSVAVFAMRPSTGMAMSGVLALGYGWRAARRRQFRSAGAVVAVSSAAVVVVELVGMRLLHAAGITATLQDTFTHHFRQRPVGGLPTRYRNLLVATGRQLAARAFGDPVLPLVTVVGLGAALARARYRPLAVTVAGAAVTSALVHPLATEVPRLLSPLVAVAAVGWAGVVVGAYRRLSPVVRTWCRRALARRPPVELGGLPPVQPVAVPGMAQPTKSPAGQAARRSPARLARD